MWETIFDVSMLENSTIIVRCPDESLVEELMNILAPNGVKWLGDEEPPNKHNSNWRVYKEKTCYWIEDRVMSYGNTQHAEACADYSNYIKCTFYGAETSDFDVATDDELQTLLGIGGG